MTEAPANAACLLSVRGLRLQIAARTLVENLNVEIHGAQVWCVLGPNGSGKSTLLHTFAGLREPQAGSVALAGRPWKRWRSRDAAKMRGLLLQHQSHAFSASVIDTVLIGRHPHVGRFGWHSGYDRECATQALQRMDLASIAGRDVLSLSGGERQRVAVAALLAQDPALFLLDEPSAHLDLAHQVGLFRHLTRLARDDGRAVVFATHDFNLAARFATHALLLNGDGRAQAGPVDQLLDAARLSDLFGFPLAPAVSPGQTLFTPQW